MDGAEIRISASLGVACIDLEKSSFMGIKQVVCLE